jgi:class 3 adenylate cyclase/TolB-like protein
LAAVHRRLSVIVCADVVGYSRLMGSDELGTLNELKAHREAIDPLFAEEGGRIVKTTGDGLLLEFPSAFHAVRAALAAQRLMSERNAGVRAERRLIFRMGIHLGDVIVEGDDIFGDGVNIAARLEEIAEPGGICLSQAVHATIHKNIDALFRDGGTRILKNIAAPVHVYNLALDGGVSAPMLPTTGPLLSIIVLPFVNLSGDARQDYLADSVTDSLTTELARIEDSFVVARNTALAYRGDALEVTEIGRELGVRYAIKGNLRAAGAGLRMNAQLIDAETGQHVWIDRFDLGPGKPFMLQHDAVARLIPPLHAHLLAASGRAPQPSPELLPQTTGRAHAHPAGGIVVHPRGTAPTATARAAAAAAAASHAARVAADAEAARVAAVPRRAPRRRMPFLLRSAIKLGVVALVGLAAVAVLGAQRKSVVEIVSCVLIAAGVVQLIAATGRGRQA